MKKLYRLKKTWYVLAKNEMEAELKADGMCEPTIEVNYATYVDEDWIDMIPGNSDENRTCGEILKEQIQNGYSAINIIIFLSIISFLCLVSMVYIDTLNVKGPTLDRHIETRCINGFRFVIDPNGNTKQMIDQKGYGVICGEGS